MKATHIALAPTEAAIEAGRPAMGPELLAASLARISRNNEGLDAIMAMVNPKNPEKSIDSIFRMIDYGHASIGDMVPVAIMLDGISVFMAYLLWSRAPTVTGIDEDSQVKIVAPWLSGQESSTRYLQMSPESVISAKMAGIQETDTASWQEDVEVSFKAYEEAVRIWSEIGAACPSATQIPRSLLEDPSEKAQKQVARMQRNYVFDRARYFLPLAAKTSMVMIMPARSWTELLSMLMSSPWSEAKEVAETVLMELKLAAPRMLRHARESEGTAAMLRAEVASWAQRALLVQEGGVEMPCRGQLKVDMPDDIQESDIVEALRHRQTRYSPAGSALERTMVRYSWNAVAIAEIRDMNRHRPGGRYCPLVPQGFYGALDQVPVTAPVDAVERLKALVEEAALRAWQKPLAVLRAGHASSPYFAALGTQYPFERANTADRFIYETELRTGTGAHFRYAHHYREVLEEWYAHFPSTRGFVIEGRAEPE